MISKKTFFYILIFFISCSLQAQNLRTKIIWEDEFSSAEKEKLSTWLHQVSTAVATTLGEYQFPVYFYIHRKKSNEPVPWAHTSRGNQQAVHFHVDPSFSLTDFQKDWTAPHEIAHLSLPFVGRENMWFSEGYASFWQWQILFAQQVISAEELEQNLAKKLALVKKDYQLDKPMIDAMNVFKRFRNYPALYWGGACYFFMVDKILREKHETSLQKIIQKYQRNRRLNDENLEEIIRSLDEISKTNVFSETLKLFNNSSGKQIQSKIDIEYLFKIG